jgi:hypothetical protein
MTVVSKYFGILKRAEKTATGTMYFITLFHGLEP